MPLFFLFQLFLRNIVDIMKLLSDVLKDVGLRLPRPRGESPPLRRWGVLPTLSSNQ